MHPAEVVPLDQLKQATGPVTVVVAPDLAQQAGTQRHTARAGDSLGVLAERHRHPDWDPEEAVHAVVNGQAESDFSYVTQPGDFVRLSPAYGVTGLVAVGLFLLKMIVYAVIGYAISWAVNEIFGADEPDLDPDEDEGHPTYGWNGPRTMYSQGQPVSVGYGDFQTGGHVVAHYVTTSGQRQQLNVLLFVSEGDIKSIGGVEQELDGASGDSIPAGIWANGKRLQEYNKVQVWTRLGGLNQRSIPGFNRFILQYPVNSNLKISHGNSVFYTTRNEVDAARIRISFPQGVVETGSSGELYGVRLDFVARYRTVTNGTQKGAWSATINFAWLMRSTSAIHRDHEVLFSVRGQYELEVWRRSPRKVGQYGSDKSVLDSILEIQDRDFRYVRGAMVGIKALATDGLNGQRPQFRIDYEGRNVRAWDGSAYVTAEGSSNPWWVVLDMLQNTTYGLGNLLPNVIYPLADFKTAADEADELVQAGASFTVGQRSVASQTTLMVSNTDNLTPKDTLVIDPDGVNEETHTVKEIEGLAVKLNAVLANTHEIGVTVARYHERYRFDGQFDENANAWEMVQRVAKCARGVVMKLGNRIIIRRSVPQNPMMLINEGNCRKSVLTYIGRRTQANEWIGQFLRRNKVGLLETDTLVVQERTTAILDSGSDANYYQREGRRTSSIQMPGVIRTEQVRRDLNFRKRLTANSGRLLSFEAPVSAIGTFPGLVIAYAHRALGLVNAGLLYADSAAASNTIQLDRPVTLASGVTYLVHVRDDDDELVEKTITSVAGAYARGASLTISGTWTNALSKHAPYSLGVEGEVVREYEIARWRFTKDLWIGMDCLLYDADNYVDPDDA